MLISSLVALLIESQTLITFALMLHVCPLVVRSLNFLCHIVNTLLEKKPYILAANSYYMKRHDILIIIFASIIHERNLHGSVIIAYRVI